MKTKLKMKLTSFLIVLLINLTLYIKSDMTDPVHVIF